MHLLHLAWHPLQQKIIQTLALPSTSAHSSVSKTIIPPPEKSLAYFHQFLPLEVMPINPTQPSFTSSSQAVHQPILVSHIHL